jgi:hypothetical protein
VEAEAKFENWRVPRLMGTWNVSLTTSRASRKAAVMMCPNIAQEVTANLG